MKPDMIIYLVKHPQTEWNARGIIQGHLDSPLTAKGRNDAEALGRLLAGKGIKEVYSSDLGRCIETAHIINRYLGASSIHEEASLREQDFGSMNGQTNEQIKKSLNISDPTARPPRGETFQEMSQRVCRFVTGLLALSTGPILIITHDGPSRALKQGSLGSRIRVID